MKKLLRFYALIIALMLAATQAWSLTWYVSTGGINTNSGTVSTAPVRDIQVAVDRAAAGETIYVWNDPAFPANTFAENVLIAGNNKYSLTLIGTFGGNNATIVNSSTANPAFYVYGGAYNVTIKNFRINSYPCGIKLRAWSNSIFTNIFTGITSTAVWVDGTGLTSISNNKIGNGTSSSSNTFTNCANGVFVDASNLLLGSNFFISRNNFTNSTNEAIKITNHTNSGSNNEPVIGNNTFTGGGASGTGNGVVVANTSASANNSKLKLLANSFVSYNKTNSPYYYGINVTTPVNSAGLITIQSNIFTSNVYHAINLTVGSPTNVLLIQYNSFNAMAYPAQKFAINNGGTGNIKAEYNWWGTCNYPTIAGIMTSDASTTCTGCIDFIPYSFDNAFSSFCDDPQTEIQSINFDQAFLFKDRIRVSWQSAGVDYRYLVVRKKGSLSVPWDFTPNFGTPYTQGASITTATATYTFVYNNTGNQVDDNGLTAGTVYSYQVYKILRYTPACSNPFDAYYMGGGTRLGNPAEQMTLPGADMKVLYNSVYGTSATFCTDNSAHLRFTIDAGEASGGNNEVSYTIRNVGLGVDVGTYIYFAGNNLQFDFNSTYTFPASGTYQIRVNYLKYGDYYCDISSVGNLSITIYQGATVEVGDPMTNCETIAFDLTQRTVVASITNEMPSSSPTWSVITNKSSGSFNNRFTINPTYTPSAADIARGSATISLTALSQANCGYVTRELVLTIVKKVYPIAAIAGANPSLAVEGVPFQLSWTGANLTNPTQLFGANSMTWTSSGSGTFSNANIIQPTYTPSAADIDNNLVITLRTKGLAPCNTQVGIESSTFSLHVVSKVHPNAGSNGTRAGGTAACEGVSYPLSNLTTDPAYVNIAYTSTTTTLTWSSSGTGSFNNTHIVPPSNAVYTPSTADATPAGSGNVNLTLSSALNYKPNTNTGVQTVNESDLMNLQVVMKPIPNAGNAIYACEAEATAITGATIGGEYSSLTWTATDLGTGHVADVSGLLTNRNTLNPTFTPNAATAAGFTSPANFNQIRLTLTVTGFNACGGVNLTSSRTVSIIPKAKPVINDIHVPKSICVDDALGYSVNGNNTVQSFTESPASYSWTAVYSSNNQPALGTIVLSGNYNKDCTYHPNLANDGGKNIKLTFYIIKNNAPYNTCPTENTSSTFDVKAIPTDDNVEIMIAGNGANKTLTYCANQDVTLYVKNPTGYSYIWSKKVGSTIENISGPLSASGTITIHNTGADLYSPESATIWVTTSLTGCNRTTPAVLRALLNRQQIPHTEVSASAQFVCPEVHAVTVWVTEGVQVGYTYQWSRNSATISGANSATFTDNTITVPGNYLYTCRVTNALGCSEITAAGVTVTVRQPITANANVGGGTLSIRGMGSLVLTGSVSGGSSTTKGTWTSTGSGSFAPSNTFTVAQSPYTVTFTPTNGERDAASTTITLTAVGVCAGAVSSVPVEIIAPPTIQANTINYIADGNTSITFTYLTGNGKKTLVVLQEGSSPIAWIPDNNLTSDYVLGNTYGGIKVVDVNLHNKVVGQTRTVVATVTAGVPIWVRAYEYNYSGTIFEYNTSQTFHNQRQLTKFTFTPYIPSPQMDNVAYPNFNVNLVNRIGTAINNGDGSFDENVPVVVSTSTLGGCDDPGTISRTYTNYEKTITMPSNTTLFTGYKIHFNSVNNGGCPEGRVRLMATSVGVIPGHSGEFIVKAPEPLEQVQGLRVVTPTCSTAGVYWSINGNPNVPNPRNPSKIILIRENLAPTIPTDTIYYPQPIISLTYGSGYDIGLDNGGRGTGSHLIYNGTWHGGLCPTCPAQSTPVVVTGLTQRQRYYVRIFNYSGTFFSDNYTGNENTVIYGNVNYHYAGAWASLRLPSCREITDAIYLECTGLLANSYQKKVFADFETRFEKGIIGFNIYRADGDLESFENAFVKVGSYLNDNNLVAKNNFTGSKYQFVDSDPTLVPGKRYLYLLSYIAADGEEDNLDEKFVTVTDLPNNNGAIAVSEVSPNPATNEINFRIDLPREEQITVEISDMTGKSIMLPYNGTYFNAGSQYITIHLDGNLSSGVYLLNVSTSTEACFQKFVIVK